MPKNPATKVAPVPMFTVDELMSDPEKRKELVAALRTRRAALSKVKGSGEKMDQAEIDAIGKTKL